MKVYFDVECPYCSHLNHYLIENKSNMYPDKYIFTCDVEDGGCDTPFVIELALKPIIHTYKIEGIKEND